MKPITWHTNQRWVAKLDLRNQIPARLPGLAPAEKATESNSCCPASLFYFRKHFFCRWWHSSRCCKTLCWLYLQGLKKKLGYHFLHGLRNSQLAFRGAAATLQIVVAFKCQDTPVCHLPMRYSHLCYTWLSKPGPYNGNHMCLRKRSREETIPKLWKRISLSRFPFPPPWNYFYWPF